MKSKAILTFDLEFWHNGEFMAKYCPSGDCLRQEKDFVEESTQAILDLLKEHGQKATFFVLGELAEKYPSLIKEISERGHEIACHGYRHQPLYNFDADGLSQEIERSINILQGITHQKPKGFRAPNFSLNSKTDWAIEILKKHFQYDSSFHPLSGQKKYNGLNGLPASLGGFYFRLLPLSLYVFLAKRLTRSPLPVLYFHPHEFFDWTPKIKFGPWHRRKIKYVGTETAWPKFKKLQKKFSFISFEQYFDENSLHPYSF